MTTTNYLSPTDFKKMVDAIPLVTEYNKCNLCEPSFHLENYVHPFNCNCVCHSPTSAHIQCKS